MDIPAMSVALSGANVMQQASLAAAKNAMDVAENQMKGIVDMMQSASPPSFGHKLDIRA